jgi:hypothetical protein
MERVKLRLVSFEETQLALPSKHDSFWATCDFLVLKRKLPNEEVFPGIRVLTIKDLTKAAKTCRQ